MRENTAAKRLICEKAVALVSDGDVIFIDGSTTCLFLPELLERKKNITVLTNSLHLAGMFESNESVTVYCTGGNLRLHGEMVMVGPIAEQICMQIHTNVMFFSARAIDEKGTITDLNEPETSLRRVAMQHTDKAVFLCDHSKFGKSSVFTVCRAADIACVVTDVPPEEVDTRAWEIGALCIQ
jgi:DeoR/GlpR family transcriptional regulator of sugar metabolism